MIIQPERSSGNVFFFRLQFPRDHRHLKGGSPTHFKGTSVMGGPGRPLARSGKGWLPAGRAVLLPSKKNAVVDLDVLPPCDVRVEALAAAGNSMRKSAGSLGSMLRSRRLCMIHRVRVRAETLRRRPSAVVLTSEATNDAIRVHPRCRGGDDVRPEAATSAHTSE